MRCDASRRRPGRARSTGPATCMTSGGSTTRRRPSTRSGRPWRPPRHAPDDDRVWLARANLAIHAGRLDEAARWLDACAGAGPMIRSSGGRGSAGPGPPAASTRPDDAWRTCPSTGSRSPRRCPSCAWLAARRGRPDAERAALEALIERVPGDTAALERLAVLAVESGQPARAAELRRRKAEADRDTEGYYRILEGPSPLARAAELAELAGSLGRGFEARGWWALAANELPGRRDRRGRRDPARPSAPDPSPVPRGREPTLAYWIEEDPEALEDQSHPGPARAEADSRSPAPGRVRFPSFRDDAAAAGLRFTFDNGRSPSRQLPETTAGGLGLLDYDGDGWLDVYVVQGGAFPPRTRKPGPIATHRRSPPRNRRPTLP